MKDFALLIHQLILTHSKNEKIRLLRDFFIHTPDPERGYALGILTNQLSFPLIKSSQLKALVYTKIDPGLFNYSYEYVGDLAETISLIWQSSSGEPLPSLSKIIHSLQQLDREKALNQIALWLNQSNEIERWALLKLITGNLRIGLSTRTALIALSEVNTSIRLEELEEVCFMLVPPYKTLFDWIEGKGEKLTVSHNLNFRPLMLSHAITFEELKNLEPDKFIVEWKWDGIRVLLVGNGEETRLYSRSGEDISITFPEVVKNIKINGVLDGELLINNEEGIGSFNDLQKRLNRKAPSQAFQQRYRPIIHLFDVLFLEKQDLRTFPLRQRRKLLEDWVLGKPSLYLDLSETISFNSIKDLQNIYKSSRSHLKYVRAEGFMVKNLSSPYLSGRVKGHWYKWKKEPFVIDTVLMYAQRGHGKRSSYYSDYTFGVWTTDENLNQILVPVGKAYSGYSNEELIILDKWIRRNIIRKFGPVSEVAQHLVFEVEFEGIQPSRRHKAGLAMRFPRIKKIRWDKAACEADTLASVQELLNKKDNCNLSYQL